MKSEKPTFLSMNNIQSVSGMSNEKLTFAICQTQVLRLDCLAFYRANSHCDMIRLDHQSVPKVYFLIQSMNLTFTE